MRNFQTVKFNLFVFIILEYVEQKYIMKNSVERRDYQEDLHADAIHRNSLVILPTGLGKTTVALGLINHYLGNTDGKAILFLAPTKVLASQHNDFLEQVLTISDIALITGETSIDKRKKLWEQNSMICSTPEIARNDIKRGMLDPNNLALIIFDEAHRGVGDYAYCAIAKKIKNFTRILGMTATLPSELPKVREIMVNLKLVKVLEKTDQSPDVKPYIQETKTQHVRVDLYPEMIQIQKLLKTALDERYKPLKSELRVKTQSLSTLLKLRKRVLMGARHLANPLFSGIRLHYALNTFESHGVTPFLSYMERSKTKDRALHADPNILYAIQLAEKLLEKGIEHSKLDKMMEFIPPDERVLIFTSFRDSVRMIHDRLAQEGIRSGMLVGKAGTTGLKQDKQVKLVREFRDGAIKVLIATRVGEEGLDIADVNWVIFYDNVPSSIRHVQRRGRTGRQQAGNLVILIAKNTIDEVYWRISSQKIKQSSRMGNRINKDTQAGKPARLSDFQ